jgi:hypothetical protein
MGIEPIRLYDFSDNRYWVDFITLGNTSLRMNINRTYLLLFLSLFFVLLTSALNGQYYVINDKDGFVNIRTKPAADGKIICQLNNGRVVREIGIEDSLYKNWVHIEFYIPTKENQSRKKSLQPPKLWLIIYCLRDMFIKIDY